MDLGLHNRRAVITGASKGIGLACAESLAREGVHVHLVARTEKDLQAAVAQVDQCGPGQVSYQALNLADSQDAQSLIETQAQADILVNNNEGPPPGAFEQWELEDWQAALDANFLAPVFMIKSLIGGMKERRFGRIVNITSAMVKSPSPIMCVSSATRAAVTALSKAVSKEVVMDNVTINNMLPEMFDTGRQRDNAELIVQLAGVTYEEAREKLVSRITAGRFGQPKEFGDYCAFLCSQQASYISGQNVQLDGGSYEGLI